MTGPDWKNRIVETAEMKVSALEANPKSWRKHPLAPGILNRKPYPVV